MSIRLAKMIIRRTNEIVMVTVTITITVTITGGGIKGEP